jgi:hypothetical protein
MKLALMNSSAAKVAADVCAARVRPALRDSAAARAAPSTAACSFALTLYNIVASMPSPTNGINRVGIIMVNMIITLPAFRLRLGGSEAGRGLISGGLEYRICIVASLCVSRLPRARKHNLHHIYRLAGLITVRAILLRHRQQVEGGHVFGVGYVSG